MSEATADYEDGEDFTTSDFSGGKSILLKTMETCWTFLWRVLDKVGKKNMQHWEAWQKRNQVKRNFQVSDIFLVEETIWNAWPMAQVLNTFIDKEGLVHKV